MLHCCIVALLVVAIATDRCQVAPGDSRHSAAALFRMVNINEELLHCCIVALLHCWLLQDRSGGSKGDGDKKETDSVHHLAAWYFFVDCLLCYGLSFVAPFA